MVMVMALTINSSNNQPSKTTKEQLKPGFHIAVRCRKAAAGIAGTIAAGMPPACRNHFNLYGNHFSRYRRQPQPSLLRYRNDLEKVESFQLFSILTASSAMKFYMETGCLRQPPANHCLPLFISDCLHSIP